MSDLRERIRNFVAELLKAYDRGDARSFAALFTDQAHLTSAEGDAYYGRDEIASFVSRLRCPEPTRTSVEVLRVQEIGSGACTALAIVRMKYESGLGKRLLVTLNVGAGHGSLSCVSASMTRMNRSWSNARTSRLPR
ncbi:YybH family protein [Subtercola sp. YIM 133946]|uniref:YybH family protein n=1 Tax=Subtercola sp. YIM 133946 TaxID=3118909 RepID=UPI003FCE63C1